LTSCGRKRAAEQQLCRKEVNTMKYKVTKIFVVEATDKQQALSLLKNEQDALKYLEYVSIKEQEVSEGWTKALKDQLTGKK
jgi:hypothetical protein